MSKCICCDQEALPTAAVCEWHLKNPSNTTAPKHPPEQTSKDTHE